MRSLTQGCTFDRSLCNNPLNTTLIFLHSTTIMTTPKTTKHFIVNVVVLLLLWFVKYKLLVLGMYLRWKPMQQSTKHNLHILACDNNNNNNNYDLNYDHTSHTNHN